MLFNSFQFLWLFPLVFAITWLLAGKWMKNDKLQNAFLLAVSYGVFMQYKPIYALILLGITAVTYFGALIIEKKQAYGKQKYIITLFVTLALLPLLVFKYYNFLNDSLTEVLQSIGVQSGLPGLNWAVPLGISFFSFQAVGYLWDVYYKRIEAERNWWDYMLFVSFFPQLASGPISRAHDLLPLIKAHRTFDYVKAVQGCQWLLWGMFMKVVVADRVGLMVDTILPNYMYCSGSTCLFGAVLYSFQIYADFAGYSLMAIGVGRLVGFDLINNFERPYFAATITEFWRRWHISLTKWLTNFVYIPLGGSRCSKARSYMNIIVTFLVSGIWHGANWTFIVWGGIHGVFQIIEKFFGIQKCGSKWIRPMRILFTFAIATVAWILFRMPTIESAWGVLTKILTDFGVLNIPGDNTSFMFIAMFLTLLIVKEWFEEYHPQISLFNNKNVIVRWISYIAMVVIILLCGVFDAGSFIYVSF